MSNTVASRQFRAVGPAYGSAVPRQRLPATSSNIRRLLVRQSALGATPEGQLFISVVTTAWWEARSSEFAADFFKNGSAGVFCDLIGFEGDIGQIYKDHHFKNFNDDELAQLADYPELKEFFRKRGKQEQA